MTEFPPQLERRISRLRWTAGLIWIVWLVVAGPTYWAFRTFPHTPEFIQAIFVVAAVLGTLPVWFAITIYRIGKLAEASDAE